MRQLDEAFKQLTRSAPDGCWMAPGRINLIGEHTDYNDGFALPFALRRGAHVAASRRTDEMLVLHSLQRPTGPVTVDRRHLRPGGVPGWAAYPSGVVWALADAGYAVGGVELVVDSDLPLGAGLSSSAALTCAVVLACVELFELDLPPADLVRSAYRAEHDFAGVPCGAMDHAASILCRTGHALLFDARRGGGEQVPFDPSAAGLVLLAIDTRTPRSLREGAYAARRGDCERAAQLLGVAALRDAGGEDAEKAIASLGELTLTRRARHVIGENARVLAAAALLREGDLRGIGPLLTASHSSLRTDFEVSCAQLDTAVEAAISAGALGARMTGGGFGGCALALVPGAAVESIASAVTVAFRSRDFLAPRFFAAAPAAGARRIR